MQNITQKLDCHTLTISRKNKLKIAISQIKYYYKLKFQVKSVKKIVTIASFRLIYECAQILVEQ